MITAENGDYLACPIDSVYKKMNDHSILFHRQKMHPGSLFAEKKKIHIPQNLFHL